MCVSAPMTVASCRETVPATERQRTVDLPRTGLYSHRSFMARIRRTSGRSPASTSWWPTSQTGDKPATSLRIGVEHEKIGVLADGRRPRLRRASRRLLEEDGARRGWKRVEERGHAHRASARATAARSRSSRAGRSSSPARPGRPALEAVRDIDQHLDELIPARRRARASASSASASAPSARSTTCPGCPRGATASCASTCPRAARWRTR